jgi:hypothetical protein
MSGDIDMLDASMPDHSPLSGSAAPVSQSMLAIIEQTPVVEAGEGTAHDRVIRLMFPGVQIDRLGFPENGSAGDLGQVSGGTYQAAERRPVVGPDRLAQRYTTILTACSEPVL